MTRVVQPYAPITFVQFAQHYFELTASLVFKLYHQIIANIENPNTLSEVLYAYIQTVGTISRTAGVRVGRYLHQFMPKLEQFCKIPTAEAGEDGGGEKNIDLWENCLQVRRNSVHSCTVF